MPPPSLKSTFSLFVHWLLYISTSRCLCCLLALDWLQTNCDITNHDIRTWVNFRFLLITNKSFPPQQVNVKQHQTVKILHIHHSAQWCSNRRNNKNSITFLSGQWGFKLTLQETSNQRWCQAKKADDKEVQFFVPWWHFFNIEYVSTNFIHGDTVQGMAAVQSVLLHFRWVTNRVHKEVINMFMSFIFTLAAGLHQNRHTLWSMCLCVLLKAVNSVAVLTSHFVKELSPLLPVRRR